LSIFRKSVAKIQVSLKSEKNNGTALEAGMSWVQFLMVSIEFFIDIILPAALWRWCRLSSQHKWLARIFPEVVTLSPSCADCLEIWEPQPSGTLRACPGPYRDCFTFLCELYHSTAQTRNGLS